MYAPLGSLRLILDKTSAGKDPCVLQYFIGFNPGVESVIITLPPILPRLLNRQKRRPCSSHAPAQVSPCGPVKYFLFSTVLLHSLIPCLPLILRPGNEIKFSDENTRTPLCLLECGLDSLNQRVCEMLRCFE